MKLETLARLCLQMLEQDSETDVMDDTTSIDEIISNDTYSEYMLNMEHVIDSGILRYVSEDVLPIQEYVIEPIETNGESQISDIDKRLLVSMFSDDFKRSKKRSEVQVNLVQENTNKRLFHKIKEVYATDENGLTVTSNIGYKFYGSKIIILNYNPKYTYHILYSPKVYNLRSYNSNSIWDIELEELGIDDDLAINLKYLVYAELKLEENPSVASMYRNIFEQQIDSYKETQIANNSSEYVMIDWGDIYGN